MDQGTGNPAERLQHRLNDPQVAGALLRLLDRIDGLEKGMGALADAAAMLPDLAATAADAADEQFRLADDAGVNPSERGQLLVQLVELVSRPETVAAVRRLVPLLPRLADAAEQATQLPDLLATAADALDEQAARQVEQGASLSGLIDLAGRAAVAAGRAEQEVAAAVQPPRIGMWGLLRALRDPRIQQTLAWAIRFGQHFGERQKP